MYSLSISNTKLIKMARNVNWWPKVTLWINCFDAMSHYAATEHVLSIDVPLSTIEIQTIFSFGKNTLIAKKYFCATGCAICNLIYSLTFCTKWYHLSCFPFFHPRLQIIEYTQENTCCSLTLMLCVAGEWTEED